MELDWLKDFLALADYGNFSRAADARNVTQPAFGRRIRALEDWIGTPLVVRSAQGAALTSAGTAFRPMAGDLMRQLDRARRETLHIGTHQSSSLSIAATHTISFTFFPGWIHRHVDLDALGTLNLISDSMEACEQIMLCGEVHFLLCHHDGKTATRLDATRYPSLTVGTDTLLPVSAADANGRPCWSMPGTPQRPTRILGYSPASGLGRILAAHTCGAIDQLSLETVFTSQLAATLLIMARDGQGAAWLPLSMVEEDLRLGRLVRAAPHDGDIPIEIRLFRSPDCRNTAADALWHRLQSALRHA